MTTARKDVEAAEAACRDVSSHIHQLDVELRLKSEEAQRLLNESNARRQELGRLSSSRTAMQQYQVEAENAQRTYDEFMVTYANKAAQYKKQIKVSLSSKCVIFKVLFFVIVQHQKRLSNSMFHRMRATRSAICRKPSPRTPRCCRT